MEHQKKITNDFVYNLMRHTGSEDAVFLCETHSLILDTRWGLVQIFTIQITLERASEKKDRREEEGKFNGKCVFYVPFTDNSQRVEREEKSFKSKDYVQ